MRGTDDKKDWTDGSINTEADSYRAREEDAGQIGGRHLAAAQGRVVAPGKELVGRLEIDAASEERAKGGPL